MSQLTPVLVCLFVGCVQPNGDSSLYARVPDLVAKLCPGSDICNSNRSSRADDISFPPGTESCCTECSCSADCSKTRSCCFQNTLSNSNVSVEKLPDLGTELSCLYPMFPQPTRAQYLYQSFLMVSSVKESIRSIQEDSSSIPCGDRKIAPWGCLHPVYSAKSNTLFKNIECARDNNEGDDVITWDAVIRCESIHHDITATGLYTDLLSKYCHINFIFPGDFNVLQSLTCYSNMIYTCSNEFSLPEEINVSKDDLRKLCTTSGLVSPYRANDMYGNVFCHICNEEYFSANQLCQKLNTYFTNKGTNGYFVALIDLSFIAERRDTQKDVLLPVACYVENVDMCRRIFCPTGQHRDKKGRCVYPYTSWLDQIYAIYVNLTLDKPMNVFDVFDLAYGKRRVLPSLKSKWVKAWSIYSIFYREMEAPLMSNNLVVTLHRKIQRVSPNIFIKNMKKIIGQEWYIGIHNVTDVLKSSNYSVYTSTLWRQQHQNKEDDFDNLTRSPEINRYKIAYLPNMTPLLEHVITKLYHCDQIELESSEFVLSNERSILLNYITKRFMFESQFTLNGFRARICLEDSGLFRKDRQIIANVGTITKTFWPFSIFSSILLILLKHLI